MLFIVHKSDKRVGTLSVHTDGNVYGLEVPADVVKAAVWASQERIIPQTVFLLVNGSEQWAVERAA